MRIIKYLFLLLLLSLVTLSIFIATQKGAFTVERSRIINSQRAAVFSYANDLKNWEDWNSIAVEDSLMTINYSNTTVGTGGFCSWDGKKGAGELKTINLKENDSIMQTMLLDGNSADLVLSFKDTLGKTKVTYKAKGKMSFTSKVLNVFNGGGSNFFGTIFENSLANLDKRLVYEINTYDVKVNGVVRKLQAFYLSQTFTSEFSKVNKNKNIVFSKINTFCKKNNITVFGKPFVIFHTYDTANELTKISICIPIKEPIFTTEGSEIMSDTLQAFDAVKTTLKGDYTHLSKALKKTSDYLKANNLRTDTKFSRIEIYAVGKNESNNPSKWQTEIYFPTRPKPIYKPAVITPTAIEETVPKPVEEKEMPSEF
ncbi:GyrI-like domain-containing protein [Flavobacterium nackdongense]|uniref:Transcriptional regulator n=1 Tax=Flavobacterium nackdongense TaxID=2547394 RepID=A0A4P6Y6E2_9FLAO|nr:GyrI-like domain-containing protein [Flavobacterium nackdongense]QBN17929.1 transcriptional regulator [Flavobacterium nackdongense]